MNIAKTSYQQALPRDATVRLRCPRCHARVALDDDAVFRCVAERSTHAFPCWSGTPVLIDGEKSLYSWSMLNRLQASHAAVARAKSTIDRLLPSLERNLATERTSQSFAMRLMAACSSPLILNVGGKHAGAACASLREHPSVRIVEMDVRPGPRTNLLADPLEIPFDDHTFDAVIIDAVLEHVTDPQLAVSEIWRVLKTGGLVYSDVPFMLQVHGGALDFWRFSHIGHRRLFRAFEEVESGISQGPGVALACAAQYFVLSFVEGKPARYAIRMATRLGFFWLKYMDGYLAKRPGALDAAMGTFFMGRRAPYPATERDVLATYRGASPDLHPVR